MDWEPTPEQRSALEQQAFLEELLKLRSASTPTPPLAGVDEKTQPALDARPRDRDTPKPVWQRFLESTGGAALVTVVLGTLGGAVITGLIQSFNARQQTRQLSLTEYIKGEHDTVKTAFDLVGQCIAASENLNTLTTTGFNPEAFPRGEQQDLVLAQKKNLRDEFNRMDEQWRSSRETLTLNMRYFHGNDAAVGSAWDRTRDTLSAYLDCQHAWYMNHLGDFVESSVADKACSGERTSLDSALVTFSESLARDRLYQWGEGK